MRLAVHVCRAVIMLAACISAHTGYLKYEEWNLKVYLPAGVLFALLEIPAAKGGMIFTTSEPSLLLRVANFVFVLHIFRYIVERMGGSFDDPRPRSEVTSEVEPDTKVTSASTSLL
ncbi:hypothetical protein B0H16DRAFT_1514027 [Mycena metata]|uniref:Uncharacterized protein n=1 Tax=Mycena metata TaxID=1033252 RepID=A0AAD7JVU9_9AGAR|nr:hypothetical protein B0H16DRAFT_1514027 [Mycena metata]